MYAVDGDVRDRLGDLSTPAPGSFDFAPLVETLGGTLAAAEGALTSVPTDVECD